MIRRLWSIPRVRVCLLIALGFLFLLADVALWLKLPVLAVIAVVFYLRIGRRLGFSGFRVGGPRGR